MTSQPHTFSLKGNRERATSERKASVEAEKLKALLAEKERSRVESFIFNREPDPTLLLTRPNRERKGFEDNPTVFGRILEGSLPAQVVHETDSVLAFHDISPASSAHILIIPKRRYRHAGALTPADLPMLFELVACAEQLAKTCGINNLAAARAEGSVSLGFHMWPFISVYHLHLHLIFPAPVTTGCIARLKFPATPTWWYVTPETVAERYCGVGAEETVDYEDADDI